MVANGESVSPLATNRKTYMSRLDIVGVSYWLAKAELHQCITRPQHTASRDCHLPFSEQTMHKSLRTHETACDEGFMMEGFVLPSYNLIPSLHNFFSSDCCRLLAQSQCTLQDPGGG